MATLSQIDGRTAERKIVDQGVYSAPSRNRYFPHSFQRTSFVPCRQRVLCLTVQRGSNSDGRRSGGVGNCHNGARAGLLERWDDQLDGDFKGTTLPPFA